MAFTASDWGQGRLLTGLTPGSSLSGFTAVITKDNLPTSALDAGSLSCLNGGGDWRFSTDINGATQLPCEIVTCVTNVTPSSTEFIAWIRFPTYASGTREVYAFWNRAGQSQPSPPSAAFGRDEVWADYDSAWHFDTLDDSAGNANSLTTVGAPTVVAGAVGDARRFATSGDYLYTDTVGVLAGDSFNTSFWYTRSVGDTLPLVDMAYGIADSASAFDNYGVNLTRSSSTLVIQVFDRNTGTGAVSIMSIPSVLEGDSVLISINQSVTGTSGTAIHNGTTYTGTAAQRLQGSGFNRLSFNRLMDSSPASGGLMTLDEPRLTSAGNTSSADQISIEYDNQNNPATFWTEGVVFVPGGGGASAAVTIPKPLFSSAAQSIAPIFNAAVSFTVSKPVFASTAQSVAPGNNGDVSFLIAKPVFASTAQSLAPVFNADVDFTIGKPVFASTAESIAPIVNGSIAFAIGKPEFAATAQAIPAGAGANASIFISKPVFASTAQSIAPIITGDVAFSINGPIFSATGQALGPNTNADAAFAISKPQFNAAAQAIGVDNNAAISFNIASPIFSIFAGGAVLEYYYAKGTQIVLIEKSTIIKAPNKSRTLGV